ncbi:MAG: ATP-binding protein [Deltaproteobacteria bacterium]|nr:ATP-binding protein [Deltaproteobacteria bacterium]
MTEYYPRDIADAVSSALENMPVVVLTGMRQTGKTTFLKSEPYLKDRIYVSFDDFSQLDSAKRDPDGFLDRDRPVTIDEAQKCPEIFSAIKRIVDRKRIPGRFLLSGSANFSILKSITESLAGRAVYLTIHPFNRREINKRSASEPFLKKFFMNRDLPSKETGKPLRPDEITRGGMPTVCLKQIKDPDIWFRGYEQTYLERDVRELSQVGNLLALRSLMRLASLRTGQLLSPSQLGRDAKMNAATTSRYISIFEASLLITLIPPYLGNRSSRVIKSSKLYFSDSGLAGHLAGIGPAMSLKDDPMYGALFETYVAQNLSSILSSRWQDAGLYFWSIQGRNEVDFVIEAGKSCMALELKSGSRWQERDLAGLKAFLNTTPHCKAAILCHNGEHSVKLGENLWAIPANLVLS